MPVTGGNSKKSKSRSRSRSRHGSKSAARKSSHHGSKHTVPSATHRSAHPSSHRRSRSRRDVNDAMSLSELQMAAKRVGIPFGGLKKTQLIRAINEIN